jgi:hypothetical protein
MIPVLDTVKSLFQEIKLPSFAERRFSIKWNVVLSPNIFRVLLQTESASLGSDRLLIGFDILSTELLQ